LGGIWPFSIVRQRRAKRQREAMLHESLQQSRSDLIAAATEAANAAQDVTRTLRDRLDDSVRQFEGAARILHDALLVCDLDGPIRSYNPAAMRMFGRNDLDGLDAGELFSLDGEAISSSSILWGLIENSSAWLDGSSSMLIKGVRRDGREFWIEPTLTYLEWSNGSVSVLLIVKSVDALMALKQSANSARSTYNSIFKTSFDAIFVCQNGLIVGANPSATRIFGHAVEAMIGREIGTIIPVDPDETSRALIPVRGQSSTGQDLDLVLNRSAVTWNGGTATMLTVKNLTDMRRLEELAVRNRENGSDLVVRYGPDFRVTFCNDAFGAYLGKAVGEILNGDLRTLLPQHDAEALADNHALLGLMCPTMRTQLECPDRSRLFDWIDHVSVDQQGEPVEYQRVGRDITGLLDDLVVEPVNEKIVTPPAA
jgi:PAS domain S-box-containing protein